MLDVGKMNSAKILSDAPYFADMAQGPVGSAAYWATTSDQIKIRVAHFPTSKTAKGTILMFPGRTDYVEKYGLAGVRFGDAGYHTLAVDWRGQGLADRMVSDRLMGHVGEFQDYQKDVATVLAAARELDLPEPFYMIGHSMGGCIGLRALMNGLPVKAAAFSAPMWGIVMKPVVRPIAWVVSSLMRPTPLSKYYAPSTVPEPYVLKADFSDNRLTTDIDMFDYMRLHVREQTDLQLGGPSLQWLNEALREMRTLSKMPSPTIPMHCTVGSAEQIVERSHIDARCAKWPNSTLTIADGGEHEVMMEREGIREPLFDRIIALFDANT
jgi:lysophospholipase